NPILEQMLARLVEILRFDAPLASAALEDAASVDDVVRRADVLVVDLGLDASLVGGTDSLPRAEEITQDTSRITLAFDALRRLVEYERELLEAGESPRPIILVNSAAAFWEPYVLAHLNCSYTTPHCRVRRANVKRVPDRVELSIAAEEHGRRLL